ALAALALSPLRRGLQRRVDRHLYPLRQAALAAVTGLERDMHVGAARPEQLAERLRVALRDPGLQVGYRIPRAAGLVDESGAPLMAERSVPILLDGTAIGVLAPRSPALSDDLLRAVATTSVTLVEVVRLRLEVTAALREAEASRARLVYAG